MRTPTPAVDWATCRDSHPMLRLRRVWISNQPRKARLFAVACCRRVGDLIIDLQSREAIEVAERYAEGEATWEELLAASRAADAAHRDALSRGKIASAAEAAAAYAAAPSAWFAATRASNFAYVAAGGDVLHSGPERAAQADLLRCIFGRLPFAPDDAKLLIPRPIDAEITALAQIIYDSDAFDRLPELAALLERHGWTDAAMLGHCRSPGPHARGCWVIDLLLDMHRGLMKPFTTLEDALTFVNDSPLLGDRVDIVMAAGFTVDGNLDRQVGKRTMGEVGLITALRRRDFQLEDREQHEGYTIYRFARVRMSTSKQEPFPPDFTPQPLPLHLPNAAALSCLPPPELADFFERHPEAAITLIGESEDKRYCPSTFVTRKHDGYRVGWYSIERGEQCVMTFENRSDAAADYLLFSAGKGRWYGRGG